jgi:hypothetical protein
VGGGGGWGLWGFGFKWQRKPDPIGAARLLLATESKRTAEQRAAVAADVDGSVPSDRVR